MIGVVAQVLHVQAGIPPQNPLHVKLHRFIVPEGKYGPMVRISGVGLAVPKAATGFGLLNVITGFARDVL